MVCLLMTYILRYMRTEWVRCDGPYWEDINWV